MKIKPARVHVIGLGDITEDSKKVLRREFWGASSCVQGIVKRHFFSRVKGSFEAQRIPDGARGRAKKCNLGSVPSMYSTSYIVQHIVTR